MTRQRTHNPQILRRHNDALAEEFLPESVDRHAGRERVGRVNQPLGKTESVARCSLRHRVQLGGRGCFDRCTLLVVGTTDEDVGHCGRIVPLLLDVGDGAASANRTAFTCELGHCSSERGILRVMGLKIVGIERFLLLGGPFLSDKGQQGL